MHKVSEILDHHTDNYYVQADWSVRQAARYMAERNIGAAAVVNTDMQVIGMFSERDVLQRVISPGLNPDELTVGEVMTRDIVHTHPDESLDICSYKMNERRCRHLPVLENGRLVGMISMRDILEIQLRDFAQENEHLRAYVHLVPPGYPTR